MDQSKYHLITGATGFIGSKLMVELLNKGRNVIVAGRSTGDTSLEERVSSILEDSKIKHLSNHIKCVEFDLLAEDLGELGKISEQIDSFWHLAAELSFKEKNREKTNAANVASLEKIINFCLQKNAKFIYFSTCYVKGTTGKLLPEDFIQLHSQFNNPYEESKLKAELIIKDKAENTKLSYLIFRPSIVISNSVKPYKSSGFYKLVEQLAALKNKTHLRKLIIPVVSTATLNLVSLEELVSASVRLSEKSSNKVFNIASRKAPAIKKIFEIVFKEIDIKIITITVPGWLLRGVFMLLLAASKPFTGIYRNLRVISYYLEYLTGRDLIETKSLDFFSKDLPQVTENDIQIAAKMILQQND